VNRRKFIATSAAITAGVAAGNDHPALLAKLNSGPIRLHPDNPHYFLWRGKPAVLITAGEHYGAVLNRDFDYVRYLEVLKAHGFDLTRIFSGAYREVAGSFNITGNTLAPGAGKFVCPWARSGEKFDLNKWDDTYFKRLKEFISKADDSGVVVELVFFCTMYADQMWEASPMNARNNVNGIGNVGRDEVYNGKNRELLEAQLRMVRKVVSELNAFDNLYYEVCNEPHERGGLTKEWNDQIIAAIVEAEAGLPKKHLIAQGFPPSSNPVTELNPKVSILNFHGGKSDTVRLNYHHNRVIAFDETGGERGDRRYRTEGWEWIMAGGAVYDHLDFSFTTDRPDGTAVPLPSGTPGGGGPELRRQLRVLKEFIEGFDFIRMAPGDGIIKEKRIDGGQTPAVRVLAEAGKAYAIYVKDGTHAELVLELPAGEYRAEWTNTKTGPMGKAETFSHGGGSRTLSSPKYSEDTALRVRKTN
jgi:cellulase (glycosyl hydrolase family 5)